jgi:CAAX prenyl protease-like protein
MDVLPKKISGSPIYVRIFPFAIFLLLTLAQDSFGEAPRYWFYLAKTICGALAIWAVRPFVPEMRWACSVEAVVVGAAIFALWVGLDPLYGKISKTHAPWNPNFHFGEGSALSSVFIAVRIVGSTFVVPPLEEVLYRSFLYRYMASPDFERVPLGKFLPVPFFGTALIFGFSHREWLAGILCACAYQWLVLRKNRLGDAMTAHAITNFLLGTWVIWRGAWNFW